LLSNKQIPCPSNSILSVGLSRAPKGSFDPDKILFMDFNIPKINKHVFYTTASDDQHALVEYTFFSKELLDKKEYEDGIKNYLKKGITPIPH